jgi:hypothetical protein
MERPPEAHRMGLADEGEEARDDRGETSGHSGAEKMQR